MNINKKQNVLYQFDKNQQLNVQPFTKTNKCVTLNAVLLEILSIIFQKHQNEKSKELS